MSNVIQIFPSDGRIENFAKGLKAWIYEHGFGLPVAAVIGTMHIVENEIIEEAKE